MSTRQRYGQQRLGPAPKRSAFGGTEVGRAQLSWGDMQPILLRSAALVGLVAAIAAAVSSDAFIAGPEPRPAEEAVVLIVQEEPESARREPAAAELAGLTETQAAGAAVSPDAQNSAQALASLSEPAPAPDATVATHAPPPPAALGTPAAAPEPAVAAPGSRAAAAVAPAALAAPAAEIPAAPPRAALAATEPGEAEPPPPVDESAAAPASVGSLAVADCPRDWVSVEGQPSAARACEDMAALVTEAGDPAEQRMLEEAASERASEIAALQFVPRIPQARPEPPARPRKTTARKAGWPADDPPNCGKKRARWRYVNDVPTWYCR